MAKSLRSPWVETANALTSGSGKLRGTGKVLEEDISDLCASFQEAVADVLADRLYNATLTFTANYGKGPLVIAGGVAANKALRTHLAEKARELGFSFVAPPASLCTDNAAMVAWAGVERLRLGMVDDLDVPPRARWPLDPNAEPKIGAGVKA